MNHIIKHQGSFLSHFPGLNEVVLKSSDLPIEPFLVFTEFQMSKPVFGPHPHAGISVMTYMLPHSEGSFINRDSKGDLSLIEPGGVHVTQAGSGIHHDEFPAKPGTVAHGFQIWINHRQADRLIPPMALHARAADIPEVPVPNGKLRVISGSFANTTSPLTLVTEVGLLHVYLQAGGSIELPAKEMSFLYGLSGSVNTAGETIGPQETLVRNGETAWQLTAGVTGAEFLFATATPIGEPVVYGGPFVMTTPEQMALTKKRYAEGEMGVLAPYRSTEK